MTVKEQLQELTQKVDKMHAMLELLLNSSGEQSPQPAIPSGTIRWGGYSDTNPVITGHCPLIIALSVAE